MKHIIFTAYSQEDMQSIAKNEIEKISKDIYEQLNKLLDRINNLEQIFKIYNRRMTKN